jgi:signal transduction histidine kinase
MIPASGDTSDGTAGTRRWRFGLSLKLLMLTMIFIMLAEILIYVPSVANFRRNWLNDRLAAAQVAVLVLEGAPREGLPEGLESRLLAGVWAEAIAARVGGARRLLSRDAMPPEVSRTIDLRETTSMTLIMDAFEVLLNPAEKPIRVIGEAMGAADFVEIIIDEAPLRNAMLGFSRNILWLSLLISGLTALLVYLALRWLIVRPVQRLARSIMAFETDPENPQHVIVPSGRADEIGEAEHALARMETTLADEFRQKKHLAALGLAISKINHDLRNMLAAAQLISDRMSDSTDPKVRRFAPKLISTLDRAITFCQATLAYGRAAEAPPVLRRVSLRQLLAEVAELAGLGEGSGVAFENRIQDEMTCEADPDHLFRVMLNIARNAVQALTQAGAADGKPRLTAEAWLFENAGTRSVIIRLSDNGPGVPARARANLFQPFRGGTRAGSTGLGLAIANELVRLQGGTITLEEPASAGEYPGASFCVTLPQPA